MGLYMYATGTQRQPFSVLSRIGITESYTSLIRKGSAVSQTPAADGDLNGDEAQSNIYETPLKKEHMVSNGSLLRLSYNMRQRARSVAATGVFGTVYDNINWMDRNAEQTLGRKGMLLVLAVFSVN